MFFYEREEYDRATEEFTRLLEQYPELPKRSCRFTCWAATAEKRFDAVDLRRQTAEGLAPPYERFLEEADRMRRLSDQGKRWGGRADSGGPGAAGQRLRTDADEAAQDGPSTDDWKGPSPGPGRAILPVDPPGRDHLPQGAFRPSPKPGLRSRPRARTHRAQQEVIRRLAPLLSFAPFLVWIRGREPL